MEVNIWVEFFIQSGFDQIRQKFDLCPDSMLPSHINDRLPPLLVLDIWRMLVVDQHRGGIFTKFSCLFAIPVHPSNPTFFETFKSTINTFFGYH